MTKFIAKFLFKLKKICISWIGLFHFLLLSPVNAQYDSVQVFIQNYPDNFTETVSKSRRIIIDKLYSGDYQDVKIISDYLNHKSNGNLMQFFEVKEYLFVLFWIADYDGIIEYIRSINISNDSLRNSIILADRFNPSDQFYEQILSKSLNSKDALLAMIKNSISIQEDMDFLELLLSFCLTDFTDLTIGQDNLNKAALVFLQKYPLSSYSQFIRRVVLYQVKISDLGFGYDCYGGYGIQDGNLSDTFMDMGYFGMSLSFYFKQLNMDFTLIFGNSKLNRDIPYTHDAWNKGMHASIIMPGIQMGYTIFSDARINFTPFAGISGTFISPVYEDILINPYLDDISFNSGIGWSGGMGLNFLTKPVIINRSGNKTVLVQLFMKFKYTYSTISFSRIYNHFDGQIHQLSLILGCKLNHIKRIF